MQLVQIPYTTATPPFVLVRADHVSMDRWRPPAFTSPQYTTVRVPAPQVLLQEPPATGWQLLEPIPLTLEVDQTEGEVRVVAYDTLVNVYGVGATAAEAISDLKSMLVDLYEELEASQAVLSPSLQQQWRRLRSVMARI